MIQRYSRKEMTSLWGEENRFEQMHRVEVAMARASADLGLIPAEAAAAIEQAPVPSSKRVAELEAETRHDVFAFLTAMGEGLGEHERWLHFGMTSSDLLDTTLALQLQAASDILTEDLNEVLYALRTQAERFRDTLCAGRSHGMHAEPTTFGLKLLGHWCEFERAHTRLATAREEISTCAMSGAVGTFAWLEPKVEAHVAKQLGLRPEPVSTQVIPRDRHAAFVAALALCAGAVERLATEFRHLQRTEVGEVAEEFVEGQVGSSCMPHKRNPILSENLSGLMRLVRAAVVPSLENIPLWHERDISHSSVERVLLPDATKTLDFALARLAGIVENLEVKPERMEANLSLSGGRMYSQGVMLKLVEHGMARTTALRLVQSHAHTANGGADFRARLEEDGQVMALLTADDLNSLFDAREYVRHVDAIFERTLGSSRPKPQVLAA